MAVITEYRLKHPIDGVSGKIEILRLRRPTFKDLKAIGIGSLKGGASEDEMLELMDKFLTRLSGVSSEDIDGLDVEDVIALVEVFSGFFPQTQLTAV